MNFKEKYKKEILLEQLKLASYRREIKIFGTGAHVVMPRGLIGKRVLVIIL